MEQRSDVMQFRMTTRVALWRLLVARGKAGGYCNSPSKRYWWTRSRSSKKVVRFWIYFEGGLIAQDLFAYSALKKHLIIIPTI